MKKLAFIIILLIPVFLYAQPNFSLLSETILTEANYDWPTWGDYDHDGYIDLFANPSKLFHNRGDGTFELVEDHGIDADGWGYWIDYDNNGTLDLSVIKDSQGEGEFFIFSNNGDGTFSDIEVNKNYDVNSFSWADYNNDGFLDVVLFAHDDVVIYKNNGQGSFTELEGFFDLSEGGAEGFWGDFNNDGFIDVFINQYGHENYLQKNNGDGSFTQITGINVTSDNWSTGGCWVDYNNDGFLDLSVTTLVENSLYTNNGDGTFTTVTDGSIVNTYSSTRSSAWGDYDNDGDHDFFVCTGSPGFTNNELYSNNGDGSFYNETNCVLTNVCSGSWGACWGDYDRDGDIDLAALSRYDNLNGGHFFINNGNGNNWINIRCIGIISNRSAIGAKVRVRANIFGSSIWQLSQISVPSANYGQNSLNAEFGLGDATVIDTILIEWPSGTTSILTSVNPNQFIDIYEIEDQVVFYNNPSDQFICIGEGAILTAKAFSSDPPISYQWQKNGENIPNEVGDTLLLDNVNLIDAGIYRCIAYDDFSSDTSATAYVDVIVVDSKEIMGLTQVELFQLVTYSISSNLDYDYYFWVDGGNIIDSTHNSITVHWTAPGYGFVYLLETGEYGCTGDTVVLKVSVQSLGINEYELFNISVYPNPLNNSTTIEYHLNSPQTVSITFYNEFGKQVDQIKQKQSGGIQQVLWTPENLPGGIYYFRLKASDEEASGKVVLMK